MSDVVEPSPATTLAGDFSSLSADNQILGTSPSAALRSTPATYPSYEGALVFQEDNYTMVERAFPGLSGGPQRIKENQQASTLVSRDYMTPHLDRTFNQLVEFSSATDFAQALTGVNRMFAARNLETIISRLYPSTPPSVPKFVENINVVKHQASLLRDLNFLYRQRARGDNSVFTQEEIATRQVLLMSEDELKQVIPAGFLGFSERAIYFATKQLNMYRDLVPGALLGTAKGAALGMVAVMALPFFGVAAPVVGGGLWAASTVSGGATTQLISSAGVTAKGLITGAAALLRRKAAFDYYHQQNHGANWNDMVERLKADNIGFDEKGVSQAASVIGAMESAVQLIELSGFGRLFAGRKAFSSAFYAVTSSDTFLRSFGSAITKRLKLMPGLMGQEVLSELSEEMVRAFFSEIYLREQGAEPISISLEEAMSQMLAITRDTLTNTAIFGIGFGTAGALFDASVYTGQRKIHNIEAMSKAQRKMLFDLPTMENLKIYTIPGTTETDLSHISDDDLRLNGQKLYESAKVDPMMPAYMSPMMRNVLQEYVKRDSFNIRVNKAIENTTGLPQGTIEGLVDYQDDPATTPLENAANFHQRITNAGENILLDGTPIAVTLEDGTAAEVRIITKGDSIQITVHKGDETGPTGTIVGKAAPSGAMDLVTTNAKEFDNPLEMETILHSVIPRTYLFDDYSLLSPENQTLLKELKRIRREGVTKMSKAAFEAILESVEILEESNVPIEDPTEGPMYRRKVPVVIDGSEDYWTEVDIEEDVPFGEALAPEEAPITGAIVETPARPTTQNQIERVKGLLTTSEKIFSVMEDENIEALAAGEAPPHNLEANAREIDSFRDDLADMEAREQLAQEEFDVLNYEDIPSVEEDVAFSEDITKALNQAKRVMDRMLERGVDTDTADTSYRESLFQSLFYVEERLNQRRVENQIAIQHGEAVPYNVSSLLISRAAINKALGVELRAPITDELRTMQELQSRQMRRLDLIQESMNVVFDKYNKDPAFKDLSGFARKAAIIEAHRAELNVEALRRFEGRKITSQNMVELGMDRLQFYSSIQEMNDTGVVRRARMLSPEERVKGVVTPADFVETGIETEIEIPREETEQNTERRTQRRSVRKTRRIKTLVEEDQYFSQNSDPETATRRQILGQETRANRTFAESALDHINAQIHVIETIVKSIRTNKADKMIKELGVESLLNLRGRDQSGIMKEGNIEGATELEHQRVAESLRKSIDKLPMETLDQIYREVVSIGLLDIRLGGYKIGDYTMAPSSVANIIARETSVTPMYGNKGEKIRGDFNKGFFKMYDPMLSFSTMIEKVRGRSSLFYKVMYSDIQDMWLAKGRYDQNFLAEFSPQFNSLPGVESSKLYYQEEVGTFGDFVITKDLLLALLQHKRGGYNWEVITKNGLSVEGTDKFVPIGMDRTGQVVEFVENYQLSEADQKHLDIYQAGMDRLFGQANTYSLQITGAPLTRRDFYIRLRPEFMELEGKQQFITGDEQKVSLWTDVSQIKDVMGTKKAVRIVGAGYEFEQSLKNISSQFFLARAFTRAETVMNNSAVRDSMNTRFHDEFWGIVKDGLERWRGRAFSDSRITKIFDGARQNFTAASLGLNLEVAVLQTFSLPLYLTMVDAKYVAEAMYSANLHPNKTEDLLNTWSTQYLLRNSAGQIDIKEGRTEAKNKFQKALRTMKNVAFIPIHQADKFTVRMGSLAAFQQVLAEIEEGHFSDYLASALDVDDSIIPMLTPEVKNQLAGRYVDYVMERTQPQAQEQHMSQFQRKSILTRSLSSFSGFTSQVGSLYYRMAVDWKRGTPGAGKAFATTILTAGILLPIMTGAFNVARKRLHDRISGQDEIDDEPFLKEFLLMVADAFSGSWLVLRDFERAATNMIRRGPTGNNIIDIPAFEIGELYLRSLFQIIRAADTRNTDEVRENNAKNAWLNFRRALAYTFGIPFTPMRVFSELEERAEN